ncbi:MAG TPA: DTW domain-containing protein, partial [Desulfosporosinus sp.]|nr:DTW domain-containing protein [Desulfosporosinus sp.]
MQFTKRDKASKIHKVKQITSLYYSCNDCGLPIINCICNEATKIITRAKFWILSSERELYRPSNTARLLKLINPDSTELFLWERTKSPEKLIEKISMDEHKVFVVFPAENEELEKREVHFELTEKVPAFII